jgi:hypothetical protein
VSNRCASRKGRIERRVGGAGVGAFILVLVAIATAGACGGKLAPVDAGVADAQSDDAGDATADAEADGNDADGQFVCSYDASEDDPCTPPANDLLAATPPSITAAAGSFGFAIFTATGPWASDPTFFIQYRSTTLPILNFHEVYTYGSPQTILFELPAGSAGQQGTLTVSGHAGNIERRATVSVTVTSCKPWDPSFVCAPNEDCGYQGDGCGGLLSCGTCGVALPYCFLGTCQSTQPTYCPAGEGLGFGGQCMPCSGTKTCRECVGGYCTGIEDLCICSPPPRGPDTTRK